MKGPLILYSGIKNGDINFEKAEKVQKEFDQIWVKNLMEYKIKRAEIFNTKYGKNLQRIGKCY